MSELRLKSTGTIKLFENDNTSNITIASPASLGADRTITLPDASVTLASGTMLATDGSGASLTALNASELGSGTVPTARLGSGTASGTTFLSGDQTYKAAGGGKVVQYAVTTNSAAGTNGTSTYATTGLEQAFTPTNASNIILIQCYTPYAAENDGVAAASGRVGYFAIYKDTTILADVQSVFGQDMAASSTAVLPRNYGTAVLYGTETAGSTDARTYKMMAKGSGVSVVSFNYTGNDSCMIVWELEV